MSYFCVTLHTLTFHLSSLQSKTAGQSYIRKVTYYEKSIPPSLSATLRWFRTGAGKTMLAEAFFGHATGRQPVLGKIEDGTTVSDYDDEEHRRKISLYTSLIPIEHKDYKINVLDAPGFTDFVGEMVSA